MRTIRPLRFVTLWLPALAAALLGAVPCHAAPKLVVVVAIDQFRGDLPHRFAHYFGEGGFQRIAREGFIYDNCLFPTANTETGPGHACMLSGAYGRETGIAANNWFDTSVNADMYCVEDSSCTLVSTHPGAGSSAERSPRNLRCGTAGDNLEAATNGNSKTISVSLKDRAAILMGGHAADLALWFDQNTGEFVSSSYYGEKLPGWVDEFNNAKLVDTWFKQDWAISLDPSVYAQVCTADDYRAEDFGRAGFESATFPHTMGYESDKPNKAYYGCVYTSPFGNDLVLAAAQAAIANEHLGADDITDLLTISFSSNDPIGHAFGPDSWEAMDAAIRVDENLAELMRALDDAAGQGNWSLFLTADHGVASFPEVVSDHMGDAKRVPSKDFAKELEAYLISKYGPARNGKKYVIELGVPWVVLDEKAPDYSEMQPVIDATAAWLGEQEGVLLARPTAEVLAADPGSDEYIRFLQKCQYPGRSGQVALIMQPEYMLTNYKQGTGHGTAHRYDQYVPLMAIGQGIRHGRTSESAEPAQIGPSVSILCGIMPPNKCAAPPMAAALNLAK